MADVKIIDLDPLSIQTTTDIYETSKNGTGSFRETRSQMTGFIKNNILTSNNLFTGNNNFSGHLTSVLDISIPTIPGTISASSLVGGIVTLNPASPGSSEVFDTSANIYSVLASPIVGTSFNVKIVNTSSTNSITLVPAVDMLFNGMPSTLLAAGQTFDLIITFTGISPPLAIVYGGTNIHAASITSGTISGVTISNSSLVSPFLLETTNTLTAGTGAAPLVTSSTTQDLIAIGTSAGSSVPNTPTNQARSIFIGNFCGSNYTTSGSPNDQHTGLGYFALRNLLTGTENTAIGAESLFALTTGNFNTAVGNSSGGNLKTGSNNTIMGTFSGEGAVNSTFANCVIIGYSTGAALNSESNSIVIGANAGSTLATGSNNVIVGGSSDVSSGAATNRIILGQGIIAANDNQAVIGNVSLTSIVSNSTNATLGTAANPFSGAYITGLSGKISSISSITTLTIADLDSTIYCTGSSSYTITLPAASVGTNRNINFIFMQNSGVIISIAPPTGTVAGQTSILYVANEGSTLSTNGSSWFISSQSLVPVNCSYGLATTPGATTGTRTVLFDTKQVDINNFYNTGTGVFAPLIPGNYAVSAYLRDNTATAQLITMSVVCSTKTISTTLLGAGGGASSFQVNGSLFFNGSTDTALINFTSTISISYGGSVAFNFFNFERISNF